MNILAYFIAEFPTWLVHEQEKSPWGLIENLERIILSRISLLDNEFKIVNNIAIHKTAVIENGAVLKGPIIIDKNCFVGAHAYLRGPIYLGNHVKIGPSVEVKQSVILDESSIAHFNYVGNSIIGQQVNMEAGSICANHYNERENKHIYINFQGQIINTKAIKFGALIGDAAKIGANAVLSPGSLIDKKQIVKRLELIEQVSFI
jgi:NDP-sugar pyrophosphorylase family protein